MRVLMVTTEYPTPERPGGGIFVKRRVEALKMAGVEVDVLFFRSAANPFNHLRAWYKMRRMLRETSYDLIHAQFGHSALISRMQCRFPVIVTYRGSDLLGTVGKQGRYTLKGRLHVLVSRVMSLLVNEVIAVSRPLALRLPRQDRHIIPEGIDLDHFQPIPRNQARQELGWPLDERIVLFVALDVNAPVKRFDLAKEVVRQVAQEMPVTLRVVTNVKPDQMPLYLNAGDALLLTSAHEGASTITKEALACNLPIIAVDVGDLRERFTGIVRCMVCEATPEALAEALVEVLREPARSNGRSAVADLAESSLAQQVIAVYRKALERNGQKDTAQ